MPRLTHRTCSTQGLLLTLAVLAGPLDVAAQRVEGRLVDAEGAAPIEGAFVVATDSAGVAVVGSLTDESGFYRLQLPHGGTVRLVAHRIGYGSTESPLLQVRPGETLRHTLVANTEAVMLSRLEVTAERRCALVEDAGITLDRIWEEARKAMTVAEWTRSSGALEMQVAEYELVLHPETLEVISRNRIQRPYFGDRPYTSLPAEELATLGYVVRRVDGTYYYAPDEGVLLSDAFLRTHCFRATRDPERPGLIGLAFEPVPDQTLPDIAGAFWLDEETAELRFLEYRYSRLLEDVDAPDAGGRVEFRRLPSGAWIVSRWGIRMPDLALRTNRFRRSGPGDPAVVTAYRETGGEVVATVSPEERRAMSRAAVVGRLERRDSGEAIEGAVVFLSGTQYRAVTDEDGRFHLADLPVGTFPLVYRHPLLDDLDTFARPVPVELRAGERIEITLYFPPSR